MGKLALKKYATTMILVVQIIIAIFTFVGIFGGADSPIGNTAKAMMVYALPFLIVANIVLLIYWLISRNWLWTLIPAVCIVCCIPYIGTFFQTGLLNDHNKTGKTDIRIASYNVARFGQETSGFISHGILSEMKKKQIDILCLQEYNDNCGDKKNSDSYKEYFPYMVLGENDMVVYSRYPITASKNMPFEGTNNSAMWANIDINGKYIKVFNVHLETTGFNRTLKKANKMMMNGHNVEDNKLIGAIFNNYTLGMIARAGQAEIVAKEIKESEVSTIVCGDFNDVPYSYVYNTVKGDLIDGFKECGKGWMFTYRGKKKFRIDYIFHDKSMQGHQYYIEDLTYSDHYPVFMNLEFLGTY